MLSYMSKKKISEENFRRSTGVKINTVSYLLKKLKSVIPEKKCGPRNKLSLRRQLLLTLDYWRNYSSLLETGKRFGISEATACRTYKFIEDSLAKAGLCKLPGKKGFTTDFEESFTVDATE